MSLSAARTDLLEGVLATLDHAARRHPATAPAHLETGRAGEQAAFFFLRRQGYTVVARDWKSPRSPGDIDLIAWDDDTLCFIEVKTRSAHDSATAEAAIDNHKRSTLRRLAGYYVRNLPDGTLTRFDVVTVYVTTAAKPELHLFRNAFPWMDHAGRSDA